MLISTDRDDLHKIVILNPKGGSGKTTLATNIAGYYAMRGPAPMLVDCDSQGFSMRWLDNRPNDKPSVHGVAAYDEATQTSAAIGVKTWPDSEVLIVDLPAGVTRNQLIDITYDAGSILIPVLPSGIDIYCASRFIAELLLNTQIDRRDCQLAVVANRTRQNTRSYRMLMRFLTSLKIPLLTALRDSQNYVHAAAKGLCIHELPPHKTRNDLAQIELIVNWLDQWRTRRMGLVTTAEYERPSIEPIFLPPQVRASR